MLMKKLLLLLLTLIAFAPPMMRAADAVTMTLFSKAANNCCEYQLKGSDQWITYKVATSTIDDVQTIRTKISDTEDYVIIDLDHSELASNATYTSRFNTVGLFLARGTKFSIRTQSQTGTISRVQFTGGQWGNIQDGYSSNSLKNLTYIPLNSEYIIPFTKNFQYYTATLDISSEPRNKVEFKSYSEETDFMSCALQSITVVVTPGDVAKPEIPHIESEYIHLAEDGSYTFFGETYITVKGDDNSDIYWSFTTDKTVETIDTQTADKIISGDQIALKDSGRLILIAVKKSDPTLVSSVNIYDFNKGSAMPFESIDALIGTGEYDGAEVMLDCDLNIVGGFVTNAANSTGRPTYYIYVRDVKDNYIKIVSQGSPFPDSYFHKGPHDALWNLHKGAFLNQGSIVGVFNYNYGLPEIYVKTPAYDYTEYLLEATSSSSQMTFDRLGYQPAPVKELSTDMFNRYVVLDNMKWVGENTQVEDAAGNVYQLYARLIIPEYDYNGNPIPSYDTEGSTFASLVGNPEAGKRYRITGFIAQLAGVLKIFPTEPIREIPSQPVVMAPNQLSGTVNIISDEVKMWVNPDYVTEGAKFEYKITPSDNYATPEMGVGEDNAVIFKASELFGENESVTLTVSTYTEYNACHQIRGEYPKKYLYGPETVLTLRRHQSTPVQSIAEYKEKYLGNEDDLPEMITGDAADFTATAYHKFADDSRAVIIETTPEWLYVRDLEPTAADGKFHSENYILIHNENGWSNPTVTAENRELRQGDIISGFALIPAKTGRGNLVSESTGFARTVKFVGVHSPAEGEKFPIYDPVDVGYVNPENPSYYTKVNPGEEDRMRLIELRNVQVTRTGTSTADYVYTMRLGDGTHTYTVATDIFEHRLQGWHTAYDDETRAEDANTFNLYGIMIKNGTGYALAMIDYETKLGSVAAPAVFVEGGENPGDEVQPFVNKLTVGITTEPGTFVYYSLNGKNPLVNTDSETRNLYDGTPFEVTLAEGSDRVVVQAFAFKPGMKPSELVTRTFVKQSRELSLLLNFIGRAEKDAVYHFNGTVKVADVVGNYLMVRGVAGHYMPIYSAAGWENLKRGDYLTDFLMLPQFAGEDDAAVLRGATVAEGAEDMFEPVSDSGQPEIDVTTATEVSDLTGNLRRKVMLTNALFVAATGERSGGWMIKGSGEGATALAVNTEHTGLDLSDVRDNVNYNVTGYIMATADGSEVEFWPIEKVMFATPAPVKADVKATTAAVSGNEYTATFYPMAEVTLTHEDPRATIYYMIGDDDTDGNTRWYEYYPGRPIVISESSRIHARAVNAQGRSSVETHVTLTRLEPAGAVQIKTVPDEKTGTTSFTLSAENLPEGAKIWFGVGSADDMIEYDGGEVVLDATDIVYACIRGGAQSADGAVCHYLVVVPAKAQEPEKPTEPTEPTEPTDPTEPEDPTQPEQPGDRVSGRVKFELTDDGDGVVKVKISPEQTLTGEYEIWYTTKTGVTLPEGGTLYTGAFDMTESGLVMAVLVEKGKPAGQTCEVTVWVIPTPTAIDSVGADGAGNVRVDGDSIIAPEGSEVYDVTGRRVRPEGLRNGIYIVRTPDGNAVKVAIR